MAYFTGFDTATVIRTAIFGLAIFQIARVPPYTLLQVAHTGLPHIFHVSTIS